jgi:hypothetical protein
MRATTLTQIGRIAALLFAVALASRAQNPAPVVWDDYDASDVAEPKASASGYYYDFLDGTFFQQVGQAFDFPRTARKIVGRLKQAYNVNAVGGVPNSSWFTNRNGRFSMSLEEIKLGPNVTDGPAGSRFTVLRAKTVGITPGLLIKDTTGRIYIVKFDPLDYPELATAAEVISTKLFYAIGYNVPQNTIFRFQRNQLALDENATYKDDNGRTQPLTWIILDRILRNVPQTVIGEYRAVASLMLIGKPKGGFFFAGVREDDANDIIPHEHRRDVRALRVFSAWLEHNDIRVGNTLDMYVQEGQRHFLRHYLIDFGSTLGSETVFPNRPEVGLSHIFDAHDAAIALVTLGIKQPSWSKPEPIRFRSVGRYSAAGFDPRKWKSNFPLVAFENMTEADARWAAQIVGSFTDEQIRAAVETGELSNPAAGDYLTRQIIARREKIVAAYLGQSPQRTVQVAQANSLATAR